MLRGIRAGFFVDMEGYERLAKEQTELIQCIRIDLQNTWKALEDQQAGIFVDLNALDQGGDPPPPQDDEREEEHGDGADQRANGERRRNKRLTRKRRVRDEDEDVNEAALKQVFKKAKVNEFDGLNKTGEDLEAWLEELEDYFAFKKFSEVGKAKIAILHLRKIAKLWWKAYMKQRTEEGEVTCGKSSNCK